LPDSAELIRQYLKDTIKLEKTFEGQLRSFAREGDDDDVQIAFAEHANETKLQHQRLNARLGLRGVDESDDDGLLTSLLDFAPKFVQAGHSAEQRVVQNLIAAFSMENGECALYEALANVAHAAGDDATEALAREIQAEEQRAAEKIFHFLPSRSKIAFNILTANEVDPSVETKATDNRLV
jgi:ferritin-like metal-binding protein YciE